MSCWILFKFSVGFINPVQHSGPIMVHAPPALQECNPRPLCSVRSLSCAKRECLRCYPGPKPYHWPVSVQNLISFWLDQGTLWHHKTGLMLQKFLTTIFVHKWVLEGSHTPLIYCEEFRERWCPVSTGLNSKEGTRVTVGDGVCHPWDSCPYLHPVAFAFWLYVVVMELGPETLHSAAVGGRTSSLTSGGAAAWPAGESWPNG